MFPEIRPLLVTGIERASSRVPEVGKLMIYARIIF
jgi:hypothetical protein